MEINEKTGLAKVVFLKSDGPYRRNQLAGFSVKEAKRLKAGGVVRFTDDKVDGPNPKQAPTTRVVPKSDEGGGDELTLDTLPEDWKKLHHMQLKKLAGALTGVPASSKPDAVAAIEIALADEEEQKPPEEPKSDEGGGDGDPDENKSDDE